MKPLLAVAVALCLAGCAADTPPAQEVRDQFERGLSGHGRLVPIDQPETPNIDPRVGGPPPQ